MQQLAGIINESQLDIIEGSFEDAGELSPGGGSWDTFLPPSYGNARVGTIIAYKVAETSNDKKVQKEIWNAIDKPTLVKNVKSIAQTYGKWDEIYALINKAVEMAAAEVGA